jgi:hypothetical protein
MELHHLTEYRPAKLRAYFLTSPNSRHRVASVSQELLEEVAKPRWIADAIAPAAVCHSGSLCLMALNVLLGWQLLFPNILKRSLAVDPKIFALLLSPYDPV